MARVQPAYRDTRREATGRMTRRFERLSGNVEAIVIGLVVLVVVVAYLFSR